MTRGGRSGAAPAAPSIDTSGTAPPAIGTTKKKKNNPKTKHQKNPTTNKTKPKPRANVHKEKKTNKPQSPQREEQTRRNAGLRGTPSLRLRSPRPAQLRFRGGRPCPTPAPLPPPPSRAAPQAAPPPARPSPVPCPRAAPSPGAVRCGEVRPEEGSGRLGPDSRGRWVLCAAWFPRRLPEILLFRWFLDVSHHTCRHTCPSQRLAQCPTAAL